RPFLGLTNVGEQQLPLFRERGYVALPRAPTMVLDTPGTTYDDYLGHLSKADRAELRRAWRRADEHGLELRVSPVDDRTSRLYPLFLEVCAQHATAPEAAPITPAFFDALASELPGQAHVIVGSVEKQPAGFMLCLLYGHTLHVPLAGLRYALSK